ncbi:hypothetical protein T10_10017 [Trichinella papuae]|uniref:Uncharacterized protein n=1 Tax=Trichinella papuae TaxID=268474 RepID=A0A0V1LZE6_9BILA|nr:hypothetical protein T10_10017 [Trichinella papuae]
MRGSKGPFLCFLLIPSHFGKMSHQGDCVTANFHSCAFCYSYHILGQSVNGRNVGRGIAVVLMSTPVPFTYPITFWDS